MSVLKTVDFIGLKRPDPDQMTKI